ncbi:unnamed protein product [Heterosigma akashiwo]
MHMLSMLSARLGGKKSVSPELMKLLVCPLTKEPLEIVREWWPRRNDCLMSPAIGVAFQIRNDGIPNMIPSEAKKVLENSVRTRS